MHSRSFLPAALAVVGLIACGTPTAPPDAVPTARASADRLGGEAPLTVDFTADASGGDDPLSYAWDFGDGATSAETAPAHTFDAAGQYFVVLSVTDADGDMDQDQLVVSVAAPQLDARVDATPLKGQAPLAVTFSASVHGGTEPYQFDWDFADGAHSTLQNPSHTYGAGGTYEARVTVTDAKRTTIMGQVRVTVTGDSAPEARASATPTTGSAPLQVGFQATVSGGDAPFTFAWDFGDGSKDDVQNPTHAYTAPGSYDATLTVTDVDGDADTAQVKIDVVSNAQPQASAFADKTLGTAPLTVTFSAQATSGDEPYTYAWDFGDGGSGTGSKVTHVYQTAGKYTATLTVTDATSDRATDSVEISVSSNSVPAVSIEATPASGRTPLAVSFAAHASGGDAPLTYAWSFGDGSTASGETASHTYQTDGAFDAVVTVTDANGDEATASQRIDVQPPEAQVPDIVVSNLSIEPQGEQVVFWFDVANEGNAATPGFDINFYLDRSAAPKTGDAGDAYLPVQPLNPGEVRSLGAFVDVPTGQYQGWVQADAKNQVAEADESNNVAGPVSYEVYGPLVINEVYYDPPGTDTGCFIELHGPPGTDLTGYSLVGINGADSSEYVTLSLSGEAIGSDGYFVVAQDTTVASSQVDLVDAKANLQNGPDAVQLRFAASTVDAVAYGSGAIGGEGSPAPDASGAPIGRSYNWSDTDDNAADFSVLDYPTPGSRNPVRGDTCGYAIPVSGSASFTGSTAGAVGDLYEQWCSGTTGSHGPDVFYKVQLNVGQSITAEVVDELGASWDTVLYLTRSDCLTEVACDDDGGTGQLSRLQYTATQAGTYYLVLDGYGAGASNAGPYELQITIR